MDVALVGLAGVLVGVLGGYATAVFNARANQRLSDEQRTVEREKGRQQLALEITKLELARSPENPNMAAEHVAVLLEELRRLDRSVEDGEQSAEAVREFRNRVCGSCGILHTSTNSYCSSCGHELA